MNLEAAFHKEMLDIYERANTECNYVATRFLQMVGRLGGLVAAKQLLASEGFSEGLTRLWEEGRLDISMEALVLQDPWRKLFTVEELEIARQRLTELGYTPK
jgi:hypothetical protein